MNHPQPTESGPEGNETCAALPASLARLERALTGELTCEEARDALMGLRRHLGSCPSCSARHGARYRRVESVWALRGRCVPEGTFEDFYAAVRERVPYGPVGGGMSPAFLDAPRTLRLWRGAAIAAAVLLAATAGFAVTRAGDATGGGSPVVRPLHDPRERLLEAYDSRGVDLRVRPVHADGTHGHADFFAPEETQPVRHEAWK